MALNLVKLCVGCEDIASLKEWQDGERAAGRPVRHVTRNRPTRATEILGGGSLYWVFKGQIRARQPILGFDTVMLAEGRTSCAILLDPAIIETEPTPFRPFQGWRYLEASDAPPDRGAEAGSELPAHIARELRALGLL